ncbi:hypothetical protein EVAR_103882_1 [Eumeta japonica]|uniref:Uncharacterized protein n=1 Tax=Eumeta variegata TaxID=151549 RepID=A0A4C1ZPU0_EUMVA|nr:hypothetical protein EVAR_103882_1 [Eumeta japonica]
MFSPPLTTSDLPARLEATKDRCRCISAPLRCRHAARSPPARDFKAEPANGSYRVRFGLIPPPCPPFQAPHTHMQERNNTYVFQDNTSGAATMNSDVPTGVGQGWPRKLYVLQYITPRLYDPTKKKLTCPLLGHKLTFVPQKLIAFDTLRLETCTADCPQSHGAWSDLPTRSARWPPLYNIQALITSPRFISFHWYFFPLATPLAGRPPRHWPEIIERGGDGPIGGRFPIPNRCPRRNAECQLSDFIAVIIEFLDAVSVPTVDNYRRRFCLCSVGGDDVYDVVMCK